MFGYVIPLRCELKVRELAHYDAWYCGLCKTIRERYGQRPRLALNYDCAFLALLLDSMLGAGACTLQRCGYKLFQKPRPVAPSSEMLNYAADVNVLLAWYQCDDDWRDERSLKALLASLALCSAAKKAGRARPKVRDAIKEGIEKLTKLENENSDVIDEVTDAFAGLLRDVFRNAPQITDERQREALAWMGYNLGRWIYLADAWNDREKDAKSHAYNPFNRINADTESASFMLYMSLNEAEKAYDLLDLYSNQGVLDNIIKQGCRMRTEQLLRGEHIPSREGEINEPI